MMRIDKILYEIYDHGITRRRIFHVNIFNSILKFEQKKSKHAEIYDIRSRHRSHVHHMISYKIRDEFPEIMARII